MVRVEDIDVDQIWRSLGPWGKYQLKQVACHLLMCVSLVFNLLKIVFIGFRPSFHCKALNDSSTDNSSNVWRDYGECTIKTYKNTTVGRVEVTETNCVNGWEYDIPREQSFVTEWDFVCDNAGLAELSQTLMTAALMIGAFVFPTIADRFGRKPSMVISHMMLFGIVLGTAFSPNYYVFIVLIILTGTMSIGVLSGSTLALESFPTEIRCYEEVMAMCTWTTAVCVMPPIAYAFRNVSWRYLEITYAAMSAWSVFQWWDPDKGSRSSLKTKLFMPAQNSIMMLDESLRWVIANGQIKRAREIIKNACKWNKKDYATVVRESGLPAIFEEGSESKDSIDKETEQLVDNEKTPVVIVKNVSLLEIIKHSQMRRVSFIMWFTCVTDSLVYYGLFMISSALYGDRYINFFLSGIMEYPAIAFEAFGLNRIGRKWTSLIFHLVAAIGLIFATGVIYGAGDNTSMLAAGTAFTLIGKMAITGAFSSSFVLTAELYPTNMRNSGLGAASFMWRVGGMIAPFFRNAGEAIPWVPGFIFAVLCLITVVLLAFVPETNGIDLPQTIDELTEWYKVNKFSLHVGKNKTVKKKRQTHELEQVVLNEKLA